jgi:hypothetical protein
MKNEYYLRHDNNKIFMCCGKAGCPSVSVNEEGLVEISDDHGNTVKMKKEEASLIKEAVSQLPSDLTADLD